MRGMTKKWHGGDSVLVHSEVRQSVKVFVSGVHTERILFKKYGDRHIENTMAQRLPLAA